MEKASSPAEIGFVFGKFMPFHAGHKAMIDFALQHCKKLIVLVCASDKETLDAQTRHNWICESFADEPRVEVKTFAYLERDLVNSSESSEEVSEAWSKVFLQILPPVSLLVSSEPYGEFVANFMKIKHIAFNPARNLVPISATQIRKNPLLAWEFLPKAVQRYYVKKIVLLGSESTGKTMLSQRLAQHFGSFAVEEQARFVVNDTESCVPAHLPLIVKKQSEAVQAALSKARRFLFIDTDWQITKSYAKFLFNMHLEVEESDKNIQRADLYFYLNNDYAYIQDGSRLSQERRDLLHEMHLKNLEEEQCSFIRVSGNWDEKLAFMVQTIEEQFLS